jgi:Domain of unknown function (DUF4440)
MLLALALFAAISTLEPRTEAAVIAADDLWLKAEIHGDGDALEDLLSDGYQSVGANGTPLTKAVLVANARKRGYSRERERAVADWRAGHPSHPQVTLLGDTAVLSWQLDGDRAGMISSCDVFVYRDGRWRALYSMHTTAGT